MFLFELDIPFFEPKKLMILSWCGSVALKNSKYFVQISKLFIQIVVTFIGLIYHGDVVSYLVHFICFVFIGKSPIVGS
jgi:hypothetical protein